MVKNVLIDENPVIILPSLASCLGLGEAIIVQRLHFLLSIPRNGKELDGHRWIYNSYQRWQEDHFPFWDIATIQRGFESLQQMHIVEACQPNGTDRQKYYRLNEGMVAIMRSGKLTPAIDAKGQKLNRAERICKVSEHSKLLSSSIADCSPSIVANCNDAINSTKRTTKRTPSDEGFQYADWFKSTLPTTHHLTKDWRLDYAQAFDDNARFDSRDTKQIWAVSRFGREDDFWKQNFLSPLKLRSKDREGVKYFDKISAKMPQTNGTKHKQLVEV